MMETLNRLLKYNGIDSKVIIWEHNTYVGDARATNMANHGIVNLGQLFNEKHSKDGVFTIGFGSYKGTVIAGHHWNNDMKSMLVPLAKKGSWKK